jgi:hypothetical protein
MNNPTARSISDSRRSLGREGRARAFGVRSVAGKYDVMNDLMSFGVHRLWKQFALSLTGLRPGSARSTSPAAPAILTIGMLRQVGKSGRVVLSDVNPGDARSAATGCSTRASSATSNAWSPTPSACRSRTTPSIA